MYGLDTRDYASFWLRFIAITIDGFILGIPMALAMFNPTLYKTIKGISIFGFKEKYVDSTALFPTLLAIHPPNYFKYFMIINLLFFIISILYFVLLTSSKIQGTLGKQLLGIKVVGGEGNRISFSRAAARYFAMMISFFMFMGFIMAAFNAKRQTLHDYMANTFVVKR